MIDQLDSANRPTKPGVRSVTGQVNVLNYARQKKNSDSQLTNPPGVDAW